MMSGFFVFILITPLCLVTILAVGLLSWWTRQCFLYYISIRNNETTTITFSKAKTRNRRHSSTTVDSLDESTLADNDDSPIGSDDKSVVVYPFVTVQFLGNQNQDRLYDFLLHLTTYIRWPMCKLEILFCIVDIEDEEESSSSSSSKNNTSMVRQTSSGLTEENYKLILELMEEGFHVHVLTCPEDLLQHPNQGSLLFSFDRIEDIPHRNFIQNYITINSTSEIRSQSAVESRTE
jgi:hypothetical protein